MARYFARLKLRLMANGMKGSGLRLAGFILSIFFGLALALFGFLILAFPGEREVREAVPVITFTLLFVGWLILPMFTFGSDETLDPSRLTLLPLSRRRLMTGLFAASAIGAPPLATLLALSGALAGYAEPGLGFVVVAVAIIVEFALCLVASRAVVTALSGWLRSRRARDLTVVVVSLLSGVIGLFGQLPRLLGGSVSTEAFQRTVDVAGLLPPGMAGRAVYEAGAGRPLPALGLLVVPVATVWVLAWWWATTLAWVSTTAEPATRNARQRPGARSGGLFPPLTGFLPRNRVGAVAAKELRYLVREPMHRAQRVMTALFSLATVGFLAVTPGARRPEDVLSAAVVLWLFTMHAINQFSADRAAYWMNVAAGGDPKADLIGKNIGGALVNLPVFLFLCVALTLITGGWPYLPISICFGMALLAIAFGLGNLTSVRLAQPMPESMTNLWGTQTGQGCGTGLIMMAVLLANAVLVMPIVVLVVIGLSRWRPLVWLAAPVSVAYGMAIYWFGLRLASNWLRTHQPELLAALSPRQAA